MLTGRFTPCAHARALPYPHAADAQLELQPQFVEFPPCAQQQGEEASVEAETTLRASGSLRSGETRSTGASEMTVLPVTDPCPSPGCAAAGATNSKQKAAAISRACSATGRRTIVSP